MRDGISTLGSAPARTGPGPVIEPAQDNWGDEGAAFSDALKRQRQTKGRPEKRKLFAQQEPTPLDGHRATFLARELSGPVDILSEAFVPPGLASLDPAGTDGFEMHPASVKTAPTSTPNIAMEQLAGMIANMDAARAVNHDALMLAFQTAGFPVAALTLQKDRYGRLNLDVRMRDLETSLNEQSRAALCDKLETSGFELGRLSFSSHDQESER